MPEQFGRYEILEEIGQGGFAIVYRARDTILDRWVALKVLRPILLNDPGWVKNFRREARTIARLDHPHIVTIYDIYEEQNRLCIVMRLVNGPSLEHLLGERGALPWTESKEIFSAIASGLVYAHNQGILHRDLKPANILLDPERGPMLTDFGLAKLVGESSSSITAGGGIVGTPHYIAPEVWEGKGTSKQSDIYALGCIFYEMVTGEKTFKGETPPAIMMAHFKPFSLPQTWPPGVPEGVSHILRLALAQNPDSRYARVEDMIETLLKLDTGQELKDTPPVAAAVTPIAPPSTEIAARRPETDMGLTQDIQPASIRTEPLPERLAPPAQPLPPDAESVGTEATPAGGEAPHKRGFRRRGCWIGAAALLAGLLIALIGISSFCSALGSGFSASLFQPVTLGETVEQQLVIPVPAGEEIPHLTLEVTGGQLNLIPGSETQLLEGAVTYNVEQLKPKLTIEGNNISIEPQGDIGLGGMTTQGLENDWDLKLGPAPMRLSIETVGAEGDIELGNLSLTELYVDQGGANLELSFSQPNQVPMDTFNFSGGASIATLTGLANSRTRQMRFSGGAGDYTLNFEGELEAEMQVGIEGGVGSLTIIIPPGTGAELSWGETSLSNIDVSGAWQEEQNKYFIAGEGPKIIIEVKMGLGNLKLRSQ